MTDTRPDHVRFLFINFLSAIERPFFLNEKIIVPSADLIRHMPQGKPTFSVAVRPIEGLPSSTLVFASKDEIVSLSIDGEMVFQRKAIIAGSLPQSWKDDIADVIKSWTDRLRSIPQDQDAARARRGKAVEAPAIARAQARAKGTAT